MYERVMASAQLAEGMLIRYVVSDWSSQTNLGVLLGLGSV